MDKTYESGMAIRVKARRVARGWTQEQLADKIKECFFLPHQTTMFAPSVLMRVKSIEEGKGGNTPIIILHFLADLFDTTTVYLVNGNENYLKEKSL